MIDCTDDLRCTTTDENREKFAAKDAVCTSAWSMSDAMDCTSAAFTTSAVHGYRNRR